MSRPRDGSRVRTGTCTRRAQVTKGEPESSAQSDSKSDAPNQKELSNRESKDDVSDDVIGTIATSGSKRTRIGTKLGNSSNETTTML